MMTGHWLTRTTRFLAVNMMLATLVACGGGGGGSDSGGFLGGADDPTFTLSIQSFDASGLATPQFSIDQPLRVVVSLRSDGDAAISGQVFKNIEMRHHSRGPVRWTQREHTHIRC